MKEDNAPFFLKNSLPSLLCLKTCYVFSIPFMYFYAYSLQEVHVMIIRFISVSVPPFFLSFYLSIKSFPA